MIGNFSVPSIFYLDSDASEEARHELVSQNSLGSQSYFSDFLNPMVPSVFDSLSLSKIQSLDNSSEYLLDKCVVLVCNLLEFITREYGLTNDIGKADINRCLQGLTDALNTQVGSTFCIFDLIQENSIILDLLFYFIRKSSLFSVKAIL